VENLTKHGHLHVEDEIRRLLLQMSPGAIGRLLVGERLMSRLHGICHTRSTPLGGRIPVQTDMDPPPEPFGPRRGVLPLDIPGVLAVDLVGRGGGQVTGDSLVDTDCHRLEHRTPPGRGGTHEHRALCGCCTGVLSAQVPGARPLPPFG
jgi:hypothetical protein